MESIVDLQKVLCFAENLSADKTTGAQHEMGSKNANCGCSGPQNFKGYFRGNLMSMDQKFTATETSDYCAKFRGNRPTGL